MKLCSLTANVILQMAKTESEQTDEEYIIAEPRT